MVASYFKNVSMHLSLPRSRFFLPLEQCWGAPVRSWLPAFRETASARCHVPFPKCFARNWDSQKLLAQTYQVQRSNSVHFCFSGDKAGGGVSGFPKAYETVAHMLTGLQWKYADFWINDLKGRASSVTWSVRSGMGLNTQKYLVFAERKVIRVKFHISGLAYFLLNLFCWSLNCQNSCLLIRRNILLSGHLTPSQHPNLTLDSDNWW